MELSCHISCYCARTWYASLIFFSEPPQAIEIIRNLSMISHPQVVSFQEMTRLMQQCELLDKLRADDTTTLPTNALSRGSRIAASSITLFSGILPGWLFAFTSIVHMDFLLELIIKWQDCIAGTKWCGTGDIAENYHDLGDLPHIDRLKRV